MRSYVVAAALCALGPGCSGAPDPVATHTAAITGVEELPGPCVDAPAGSSCQRLRITCEGLAPIDMRLSWRLPAGPPLGTVLFGSGSAGRNWYSVGDEGVVADLLAAGYLVVERAWDPAEGWFLGPGGVRAVACRYDRVLRYVKKTLHLGGPLCATGTSAGSVELGYNLTRYGAGSVLRAAVLDSGPAARLDTACHGGLAVPAWPDHCAGLVEDHILCAAPVCQLGDPRRHIDNAHGGPPGAGLCSTAAPTAAQLATLRDDSALGPGALTSFPGTRLRFLYGDGDCTGAAATGLHFAEQVLPGNDVTVTYVAGAGHSLRLFPSGRAAVTSALLASCVP